MWETLSKKYGFDVEVKRLYKKDGYYTTLDIELRKVSCFLVYSDKMQKGQYSNENTV